MSSHEEEVAINPIEVEAKLSASVRHLRRVIAAAASVALVALVASNLGLLVVNYKRGVDNRHILEATQAQSGPEAQAVSTAYLQLFLYQIDCDGHRLSDASDNALIKTVAMMAPALRSAPPIDLSSTAKSCLNLPLAQKNLDKAVKNLVAARKRAGR